MLTYLQNPTDFIILCLLPDYSLIEWAKKIINNHDKILYYGNYDNFNKFNPNIVLLAFILSYIYILIHIYAHIMQMEEDSKKELQILV